MRFFIAIVATLCGVLLPTLSHSEVWTSVDDRVLRSDLALLADAGILKGPLASWPVNWSQVRGALDRVDRTQLARHVNDAVLRIERVMPSRRHRGWGVEVDVAATNRETLIRSYGAQARGDYDAQGRLLGQWGGTHLAVSVGLQDEPFGRNLTFDNAYLAQEFGNWIAYIGTVERWWGAGWNSALMFSTSARPQPQIGIRRNSPDPFKSKWLSWLGSWSVEAFLSWQDESGGRFDNDLIAGLRADIQPFKGFTFSVKRALQLCGNDRPCGFSTWIDSLFPVDNADNTGTLDEPGNQMAGFDARYGTTIGRVAWSVYGEIVGEDETDLVISKLATLWGTRFAGPWGNDGSRWDFIFEYADTLTDRSFFKPLQANVLYQNFIYSDGWRYRGRSLGASQDNDTRLITATGQLTDARNRFYRLTAHHADINTDGTGAHSVSLNAETINILELETIWPTMIGDVRAEVRFQDDKPNTPDRSPFTGAFEISYQIRF
ncbi:MAG: capsule assembly Wzi family protein [Pseudomonadota bacterium]